MLRNFEKLSNFCKFFKNIKISLEKKLGENLENFEKNLKI